MKYLTNLLCPQAEVTDIIGSSEIEIKSVEIDSRKVLPGSVFFAIKGVVADGHNFIDQAIKNGAVAIVCEHLPEIRPTSVTFLSTKNSSVALGWMASSFYDNPSSKLILVGVTGTNGKTTIVNLLYQVFRGLGFKTGLFSTIVNKIDDELFPATHTTPDPIRINELMAKMVAAGCRYCFMEVSSHSVIQNRIAGLTFKGGIFTNLTHDHLDYHGTFDAYLKAKKQFFDDLPGDSFALVNKDDRNGMVMVQNTKSKVYVYSLRSLADFRCKIVENQFHGLQLNLDGRDCWFKLIGVFNAYNLLAVYSVARLLGQDQDQTLTILSSLEPVEGRFNTVYSPGGITAIVDYAHTPDALQNVLETIQSIRTHKEQLITVVGAGGNRDSKKRPVMAQIATRLSDRVILTSDNPRFEDPEKILDDMKHGIEAQNASKVLIIQNREEAIKTAYALAKSGDILLIAGKGHEAYQEIKGVKYPFDDKKIVEKIMKNEHSPIIET
jgi:UDP-N-acetylmuramoyl-L-alanyl-D-glutamate--2,6-diaminopimelate ligase